MNKRFFLIIPIFFLLFISLTAESTVSYFTGLAYTNTVLKGSAAWDNLVQMNALTGLSLSTPLEGTDKFNRKVRVAFNIPLTATVRQLDGVLYQALELTGGTRSGFNFFFGPEFPLDLKKKLFTGVMYGGPVIDYQSFNGSIILSVGVEGGAEARFDIGKRFYTGMGLSLFYNFWGLHTAGDYTRYDIYTNGGLGLMVFTFLGFNY